MVNFNKRQFVFLMIRRIAIIVQFKIRDNAFRKETQKIIATRLME